MFSDVDESLRERLTAEMPIEGNEVDVDFDRPTREWSSRLSKPTLNLFLFDVRERTEFRDSTPRPINVLNGTVTKARPPLRIDLSYIVTAWAKEPADEHRILARALSAMYRSSELPAASLAGVLAYSPISLLTRVMTADHHTKPADLWGVLDNELHASLMWVVTAPLDIWVPETGPMVRTRELRFGEIGREERETFTQIGGTVHAPGDPDAALAGVTVSVVGTALRATTGADGRFRFEGIRPGDYIVRLDQPEKGSAERNVTVPSANYDFEL